MDETYKTIITIYDIFNKQHQIVVYPLSVRRLLKDVKAQWENYGEELLEWLREYIYDSISDSK